MFNINNFVEYLQTEIKRIKKQINTEKQHLQKLPSPDEINLEEYGRKKDLINQYFEDHKFFEKIVVYLKKEHKLKQKIVENKKNNLSNTINTLEDKKERYEEIIKTIKTTGKLPNSYPNEELIKILMDYACNNAISCASFFPELLHLLDDSTRHHQSNDLLFNMEKRLLEFFQNGQLKANASLDSLSFTFTNFLKELSSLKQNPDTKIYSENLKLYMKGLTSPDKKNSEALTKLQVREEALTNVRKHVKYHKIVNFYDDVDSFTQQLKTAGFDSKTINNILLGMQTDLREQKIKEAELNTKQIINDHISPTSYKIIETAKKILKEQNNLLYGLIKRRYEDILSLCNYISMAENSNMSHNLDLLVERIADLEMTIKVSQMPKMPYTFPYNFLINQEGNITFNQDLEFLDIAIYNNILEILELLYSNALPLTPVQKSKDNITISKVGEATAIYIASKNNLNFIIGVCTESTKKAFLTKITSEKFQLMLTKTFKEAHKDQDFVEKQQKYNQIVLNTLSPKNNIELTNAIIKITQF